MRVLVLGGLGIGGRAEVADLARNPEVDEVGCADADPKGRERLARFVDMSRVSTVQVDAAANGVRGGRRILLLADLSMERYLEPGSTR